MATQFRNEILKISVAEICQTIGFQGICSTPLDVLSDLLHRYMTEVCRLTHRYTEHFNRTDPNVDDLGLAFRDMGISIAELEEYVNTVDCPAFPEKLPSLPVSRVSNLNFLKPGSREIVSRPIHIHEHLPPMYPEKEEEEVEMKVNTSLDDMLGESSSPLPSPQSSVKRSSDGETSPAKKPKYSLDEEGQPIREIESVMMTTSGFISSAREGKLPEARVPNIPMAAPRSASPSNNGAAAGRKKLAVEKLIRQKNNNLPGPSKPPPNKQKPVKEKPNNNKSNNKAAKDIKIPKMPKIPKLPPKIPPAIGPGSQAPPLPITQPQPGTPLAPPKLKMPTPKPKTPKPPKPPKNETKKPPAPKAKEEGKENETKKAKKEKEPGKKVKEKKEKDTTKKSKENKKDKEGKKEKEPKKEKESKKEKENKKEKEKERERELIRALAASSAVTVTSIPAPSKPPDIPVQDKAEAKSKLSIFKKINKSKGDPKDIDRQGDRDNLQSRDSSPVLMIDETPRLGHRRPTEDFTILDNPIRRLDPPLDTLARSPREFSSYPDDLSPPGTPSAPRTPEIPNLPVRPPTEKRTKKEKAKEKKPRKDRSSKSPKCGFSPVQRDLVGIESETPERPKTPEILPLEEIAGPCSAPFSLPPFPNVPGFIPPFSRFPFIHPFAGAQRPGLPPALPDLRLTHHFITRPPKRALEEEHLPFYDPESLERPLTPRHDRDSSPLPPPGHQSPLRSPSPHPLVETPPRPRTPAHHSPPPTPKLKLEKPEKEKKKDHKKEKKEKEKEKKEKEKEKGKKKKDKKDKDKEKEPEKKKKEKLEKKEKKKGKKEKDDANTTAKAQPVSNTSTSKSSAPPQQEVTPKLVIKPVVKHPEEPPETKSTTSGPHDDQPGSPEIAKISALITRPPRGQQKKSESPPVVPVLKIREVQQSSSAKQKETAKDSTPSQNKSKETKEVPPLKIKNISSNIKTSNTAKPSEEKKSAGSKKSREKKEKKEKAPKDTGKATPSVSNPSVTNVVNSSRGSATPPVQPPVAPQIMHVSPPDPPKSKKQDQQSSGLLTETVGPIGHFVDDQGNEVWICPTCGKQDDGTPMIGCDTCDDWYHWVCVGIQVAPNEEVNWYCPRCVSQHKQRCAPPEKKKRGRKKKYDTI